MTGANRRPLTGCVPGACATMVTATVRTSRLPPSSRRDDERMRIEYQLMTETLTPSRLWKRMTLDQRQRAAHAFWADPEATDDQVQAALLIAQQKKFRAKTVIALDDERKSKHLATLGVLPDA